MRLTNRQQLDIVELAKAKGWNPANLSLAQHRILAIQACPRKFAAVKDAVASRIRTQTTRVAEHVSRENEAVCRRCPHNQFATLKDNSPACNACGCSGKFLRSKWEDPEWFCPLTVSGQRVDPKNLSADDPPTWSNLGKPRRGEA